MSFHGHADRRQRLADELDLGPALDGSFQCADDLIRDAEAAVEPLPPPTPRAKPCLPSPRAKPRPPTPRAKPCPSTPRAKPCPPTPRAKPCPPTPRAKPCPPTPRAKPCAPSPTSSSAARRPSTSAIHSDPVLLAHFPRPRRRWYGRPDTFRPGPTRSLPAPAAAEVRASRYIPTRCYSLTSRARGGGGTGVPIHSDPVLLAHFPRPRRRWYGRPPSRRYIPTRFYSLTSRARSGAGRGENERVEPGRNVSDRFADDVAVTDHDRIATVRRDPAGEQDLDRRPSRCRMQGAGHPYRLVDDDETPDREIQLLDVLVGMDV
jgi:hypothetical protein